MIMIMMKEMRMIMEQKMKKIKEKIKNNILKQMRI